MEVFVFLLGAALGALVTWFVLRSREEGRVELVETFRGLAAEALQGSSSSFLELAKTSLDPFREKLEKADEHLRELEKARTGAYAELRTQVEALAQGQRELRDALRTPTARGRWGEIQLRRVVELAGMLRHCDFVEQTPVNGDGQRLRPDLIVKLPGGKHVVVDAKTPLQAYLEACEAPDEETRKLRLRDHARTVREHLGKLSARGYWEQVQPTPEFVVMFLPGEAFFSAALEQEPGLIEEGASQRVLLATPTTLIALLRTVAYGWQQETLTESARVVVDLGRDLYKRLGTWLDHFRKVGKHLDGAVDAYNDATGSLEQRVLPAARRFTEHGVPGTGELPELAPIERRARPLQAPEAAALPAATPVEAAVAEAGLAGAPAPQGGGAIPDGPATRRDLVGADPAPGT